LASLAVAIGIFLAASWAGLWLVLPPMGRAVALFALIVLIALGAGLGGLLGPTTAGFLADVSDGQMVPMVFALGTAVVTVTLSLRLPTTQVFAADPVPAG
jgi:MFS family permease